MSQQAPLPLAFVVNEKIGLLVLIREKGVAPAREEDRMRLFIRRVGRDLLLRRKVGEREMIIEGRAEPDLMGCPRLDLVCLLDGNVTPISAGVQLIWEDGRQVASQI